MNSVLVMKIIRLKHTGFRKDKTFDNLLLFVYPLYKVSININVIYSTLYYLKLPFFTLTGYRVNVGQVHYFIHMVHRQGTTASTTPRLPLTSTANETGYPEGWVNTEYTEK